MLAIDYIRAALVVALLPVLVACSKSTSLVVDEEVNTSVPVRAAMVLRQELGPELYFAGVARARQRARLSFQVGGVVASRPVKIGQSLARGQLIATLYNPQLGPAEAAAQARLAQLQSDLEQAERELLRLEQLYQRGLLAQQSLEQQQSLIESQRAAIDNASANLLQTVSVNNESILRAPFAAQIEELFIEPGEFAQPGQAVVSIAGQEQVEVEIRVPAHSVAGLDVGAPLTVRNSISGEQYRGFIAEIGQARSGKDSLLALIVSLDDTNLGGGEAVEVALQQAAEPGLSIPLNAVMRSAQGLTVFKIDAGLASRVAVSVEQIVGERAVLSSDTLQAGDRVVYAGLSRIAPGDRLEVLP